MIEKVNPKHPDKVADRIAGALVDYAYTLHEAPRVAFEVLVGHGNVYIIVETSIALHQAAVESIVQRITESEPYVIYNEVPQDPHLSDNQAEQLRAGDNGIFKGVPISPEVKELSAVARSLYAKFPSDGKYILAGERLIICQSNAERNEIEKLAAGYSYVINPLGPWTGGTDVDTGAVNRKLGSDMGDAVTGGGLHGKDLSKADVAVNIYAHLKAQETGKVVELHCAIGDETIDGVPYSEIVEKAREYIKQIGGFEKLGEWGLV